MNAFKPITACRNKIINRPLVEWREGNEGGKGDGQYILQTDSHVHDALFQLSIILKRTQQCLILFQ
jgi:hypothetical protein